MAEPESKRPISQPQEDLLLELFLELNTEDRVKVIKYCRDLMRESKGRTGADNA